MRGDEKERIENGRRREWATWRGESGRLRAPYRDHGYATLLTDLKARVRAAQLRAAVSVNRELILLYWDIGKIIVEAQKIKGYGKQVVERLAEDLHEAFPKMDGFSPRNVWRMRAFYLAWTEESQKNQPSKGNLDAKILPQLVAELHGPKLPQPVAESAIAAPQVMASLPWGHNIVLLHKLESNASRLWYAHKSVENGWSRAVLTHHIETKLHKREGKAITNFQRTLPSEGEAIWSSTGKRMWAGVEFILMISVFGVFVGFEKRKLKCGN
jgi:predicted nuclease of restriction endonuclease-like (RecB) superfamily